VFDFALFFVLIYLVRKKKNVFEGEVGIWYLAAYSFGRFVIEFFRGDLIRGGINGLSTSQIISLIMGTVCIGLLVYLPKRQKKLQNK
ncbi:prolipoprotein diacylglyceryl transferase family protein, partial [uncultured Dubosiella sp.]|uniref:prolipoprotein diacylglyceryl transferase family protein n=1 Tax=uncultured Dubosiella sp. TaxID=1937011 RepID=UPI0026371997